MRALASSIAIYPFGPVQLATHLQLTLNVSYCIVSYQIVSYEFDKIAIHRAWRQSNVEYYKGT